MNVGTGRKSKGTKVRKQQTIYDIGSAVARFGGDGYAHDDSGGDPIVTFRMDDPDFGWLTFRIPLGAFRKPEDEENRLYRCGYEYIEGTLVAIAEGMLTPAKGFLAFTVGADGTTLFDRVQHMLPPKKKTIACRWCGQRNRVPIDKELAQAKCGHCHRPLASNTPALQGEAT